MLGRNYVLMFLALTALLVSMLFVQSTPLYAPNNITWGLGNFSMGRAVNPLALFVNKTNLSGTIVIHLNWSNDLASDVGITNMTLQFIPVLDGAAYTAYIFNQSLRNFTNSSFNTALLTTGVYTLNISVVNVSYPGSAEAPSINYSHVNVTIDNTPPNVTLNMSRPTAALSHYNGSNFSEASGMVTFNFTVLDNVIGSVGSVVANFTNASDNAAGTMFTRVAGFVSGSTYNMSFANISENFTEGIHQLRVIGNDSLNNTNATASIWFKVDRTPPNVSTLAGFVNNSNYSDLSGVFTFNVTVIDGVVGVSVVNFSTSNASALGGVAGNFTATNNSGTWGISFASTNQLYEGLHQVRVIAYDYLNHTNLTTELWFGVDRTVPNASLLVDGSVTADATLATTINFSENVVAQYGMITFNVTAIDGYRGVLNVNISFDNASGNAGGTAFNRTAANFSGNWNVSFENISANFTDGLHTVTVMANDGLNNSNRTTTFTFRVDRELPNASFVNTVTTGANFTEATGRVAFNASVIDGSIGVLEVNMSFDNASGVGGTAFNRTAANFSGYWNVTLENVSANLTDGLHVVRIMANDRFNHSNRTTTFTFRVDREAPNTSFVNTVTTGANFTEATGRVVFNASVIDGVTDISTVNMSFDNASGVGGTAFNRTAANFSGYWNVTLENVSANLTDGLHVVRIMANDWVNHSNRTTTFTFRVDRAPPNVSVGVFGITNSSYGDSTNFLTFVNNSNFTSGARVVFNATVIDGVTAISTVNLSFSNLTGDGGTAFNRTAANFSGNWNVTFENIAQNFTDGRHRLFIMANDWVNHSNRTTDFWFTVDTLVPNVSMVTGNGTKYSRNNASKGYNVTVSDVNYVTSVIFMVSNDSNPYNLTANNVSGTWNAFINASTLPEGAHNVTVFANDSAGNLNRIKLGTFIVDRTPPTVSLSKASTSTSTSLVLSVSTSADSGTCTSSRGTVAGTGASQTVTDTNLNPDTTYSFDVTCADDQGNSGSLSQSFKTDGIGSGGTAGSSSGGGGGGGGGGRATGAAAAGAAAGSEGAASEGAAEGTGTSGGSAGGSGGAGRGAAGSAQGTAAGEGGSEQEALAGQEIGIGQGAAAAFKRVFVNFSWAWIAIVVLAGIAVGYYAYSRSASSKKF